jgi:hypothetical protein
LQIHVQFLSRVPVGCKALKAEERTVWRREPCDRPQVVTRQDEVEDPNVACIAIDILPPLAGDMTVEQWVDNQAPFHMSLE